jgi:hypothetical protein
VGFALGVGTEFWEAGDDGFGDAQQQDVAFKGGKMEGVAQCDRLIL